VEHARIYPIYKKEGSEFELNNYRPIALLSVPYKLYTTIINQKNVRNIGKIQFTHSRTNWIRKDMDTSLNINILLRIISDSKKNTKPLHTIFIDLSKHMIQCNTGQLKKYGIFWI